MSDCPNCPGYQAEIRRLEVENRKLQIKVKKLEIEINRLRGVIYGVCQWCYQVAKNAANQMSSHVPRGTWAHLKGKYEVASSVYNTLRGE